MILKNVNKRISFYILCLMVCSHTVVFSQADKKLIRKGNGEYGDKNFPESEVWYRKAIDRNRLSTDAGFNLGDALYKQNKYEEATKQFLEYAEASTDNKKKAASFYNLGNSLLSNNKVQESIAAYKDALKLHPESKPAKYNLAYAQDLLKQQEEEKKQNNQDKENQQENKDKDQNKDQNKEQEKDQNKDQKEQQQKQGISKEDAQRLLDAIANDEKKVQEKVKLTKAAKDMVRTLINW